MFPVPMEKTRQAKLFELRNTAAPTTAQFYSKYIINNPDHPYIYMCSSYSTTVLLAVLSDI